MIGYWVILIDGSTVFLLHRQHHHQLRWSRFLRPRGLSHGLDRIAETQRQVLRIPRWFLHSYLLGTLAWSHFRPFRHQVQQNIHPTSNSGRKPSAIQSFIAFGDYLTCSRRYGANEYFANNLLLNNNLFVGNLGSLMYKSHYIARSSKSWTEDSQLRKSKCSTREPRPSSQTSHLNKGSGSIILTLKPRRSLNADAN